MNKEGKMKSRIFFGWLLLLTLAFSASAQQQTEPQNTTQKNVSESTSETNQTSTSANLNTPDYVRPNAKERRNNYLKSMFGPYALARTAVGAGIGTWRNSPEEWGDKWEGFGRRVASGVGKNVIKQTTIYALDESFKLDSKFYRSRKRDAGSRIKNALISPFTARTESGKRVFGFPRIAGTYASNIIARETWYPKRYDYKDGLRSGTISLGFNAAFNLIKEFTKK
jgi:hypothetical protein